MELASEYAQEFSVQVDSNWSTIAADIALPFAMSGILTEFRGANNTAVIKQDDVDLINYPLDYSSDNYTQADKLDSLDYVCAPSTLYSHSANISSSMQSSSLQTDLQ